ncbi:DUF1345 domain-containing protein [Gordonia sinesedis]
MLTRMLVLLELVVVILGIVWLVLLFFFGTAIELLLIWDVAALLYLAVGWSLMRRELSGPDTSIRSYFGPRWYMQFFTILVSCSGLAGALILVVTRDETYNELGAQAVAALTILLSWLLLHSSFAQIYARENAVDGGLEFPRCPTPQFTELVYFAMTIGTTFAVSDVAVTTRSMRRRVTVHSVISFFFNALLIALVIDWLKSA